jgi:hypothetical protein
MSALRKKLTDILSGQIDEIRRQWESTEAAGEFEPLPSGTYECHIHSAELFNAKTGTPGVKVQFRVCDGEHVGRCVFHDCWLTEPAMPGTKRDLAKLAITDIEQLDNIDIPPDQIRCSVRVARREDDNGESYNRVRRFDLIRIDEPESDAFAPADEPQASTEANAKADNDKAETTDGGET